MKIAKAALSGVHFHEKNGQKESRGVHSKFGFLDRRFILMVGFAELALFAVRNSDLVFVVFRGALCFLPLCFSVCCSVELNFFSAARLVARLVNADKARLEILLSLFTTAFRSLRLHFARQWNSKKSSFKVSFVFDLFSRV